MLGVVLPIGSTFQAVAITEVSTVTIRSTAVWSALGNRLTKVSETANVEAGSGEKGVKSAFHKDVRLHDHNVRFFQIVINGGR